MAVQKLLQDEIMTNVRSISNSVCAKVDGLPYPIGTARIREAKLKWKVMWKRYREDRWPAAEWNEIAGQRKILRYRPRPDCGKR
jgi:hypothetical protein